MVFMPLSMEIISVFKGWMTRLRMDLFYVSFGIRETFSVVEDFVFPLAILLRGYELVASPR